MALNIATVGPGYGVDGDSGLGIVEVQPGYALNGAYGVDLVGPTYDNVELVGLGQMSEDTKKYLTWAGLFLGGLAVGIGGTMLLRG